MINHEKLLHLEKTLSREFVNYVKTQSHQSKRISESNINSQLQKKLVEYFQEIRKLMLAVDNFVFNKQSHQQKIDEFWRQRSDLGVNVDSYSKELEKIEKKPLSWDNEKKCFKDLSPDGLKVEEKMMFFSELMEKNASKQSVLMEKIAHLEYDLREQLDQFEAKTKEFHDDCTKLLVSCFEIIKEINQQKISLFSTYNLDSNRKVFDDIIKKLNNAIEEIKQLVEVDEALLPRMRDGIRMSSI